jgi:acyl-coenzyme A thioesterase PaaI-like protein
MPLMGGKNSCCYVCGPNNPLGLRVSFSPDGAQRSQARHTARPEHAGWNGILNGGVTFALMDEALGWPLYYRDLAAVTALVEMRFHKPIAVGAKLIVKPGVLKQRRRLFEAHAEIRVGGSNATLLAQAGATTCLISRRTELEASSNGKEPNRASVQ